MNKTNLGSIMDLLKQKRGFDFFAYQMSFVEKQIQRHIDSIGEIDDPTYLRLITSQETQLNGLADLLTVNVSKFFRNPLVFEVIRQVILPKIAMTKKQENFPSLRIWSAGCAYGEEAYSMAILVKELLTKGDFDLRAELFATDIDQSALEKSEQGKYYVESLKNVQYQWLTEYFDFEKDEYSVVDKIKDMVRFSQFDLIDKKHHAPVESIFGNFDIILCRNVLIYFKKEFQEIILSNLTRSLAPEGYLVLGESEIISEPYQRKYHRLTDFCKIYQKVVDC